MVITTEELVQYFKQFGDIIACKVIKRQGSTISRGFGFVIFSTMESVRTVIERKEDHRIRGKWVECKEAILRQEMVTGKLAQNTDNNKRTPEEKDPDKSKAQDQSDNDEEDSHEGGTHSDHHEEDRTNHDRHGSDHLEESNTQGIQKDDLEEAYYEEEAPYSGNSIRDQHKVIYDIHQQIDEKNYDEEEDSPAGKEEPYEDYDYQQAPQEGDEQEDWSQYPARHHGNPRYQPSYYPQQPAPPRDRTHQPYPPPNYTGEDQGDPSNPYTSTNNNYSYHHEPYQYRRQYHPQAFQGNPYHPHPQHYPQHYPQQYYSHGPQPPYPYQAQQTEQSNRAKPSLANPHPGYQEVTSPFSKSSRGTKFPHSHTSSEHCHQNRYPYESPQYFYLQKMPRFDPRMNPPISFSSYLANPQQISLTKPEMPTTQSQSHQKCSIDLSNNGDGSSYDHFSPSPLAKPLPKRNSKFARTQSYLSENGTEQELSIGTPQHSTHVQERFKKPEFTPQHPPRKLNTLDLQDLNHQRLNN
jgi:hypothetical protein